jgi:DNA mismatch repair protein MutL
VGLSLVRILEPKEITELRSEVVDQIAAGEVVERPAHLVKELVENSIDAGATEVEIEFDNGGRSVRVTDNGSGIRPKDLARALARHATSKISSADDLWKLQSFGFRGEALASIGAVSRLDLTSRPHDEVNASRVVSEFGRIEPVSPSAGNFGTTIVISDLFENVPARLKFMKSETAEGSQIRAVVKAISMSHPEVGFRVRSKSKSEFTFRVGETFEERAKAVLGIRLHTVTGEFEGIKVEIAFSGPQDVIGNSKGLWFFVQNRWIQDRSLQAAVIEAYRGLLMHGEYPYVVAKLQVPDGEVDVNIHPAKSAVKFRDPSRAFRVVSRTLRAALELAPWLGENTKGETYRGSAQASASCSAPSATPAMRVADFTRPYQKPSPESLHESEAQDRTVEGASSAVQHYRFESPELDYIQVKRKEIAISQFENLASLSAGNTERNIWSRMEVLGQAAHTYLVCQDGDRLVFVDQHAAHERVAYERLMRAWRAKGEAGAIETQSFLFPHLVDLEPEHLEALLTQADDLKRIGLVIEPLGPRTVSVTAMPSLLKEAVIEKSLKELAQAVLERGGSFVFEERIGDVFARMACHSVVRAGQTLSLEEMRQLLLQMDEFPLSSFCPHGRPVSVEYPFARLERDFGRIN